MLSREGVLFEVIKLVPAVLAVPRFRVPSPLFGLFLLVVPSLVPPALIANTFRLISILFLTGFLGDS